MRTLLVVDTSAASLALSACLKAQRGAVIDIAETGEEALEMVRLYDYDAVVLDLKLPDMDGYDVLRRMRDSRTTTPVVALSNSILPKAKVRAFSLGADDVITKPFDDDELAARIQAIVRRSKGHSKPVLQLGRIHIDLDIREATVEGTPVHLSGKEYAILELLLLRKGMVLTKEVFLDHLYGGMDEPDIKIIDVFICKLRKKLTEAGAPDVIGTVWGRGYTARDPNGSTARELATPSGAPRARIVPKGTLRLVAEPNHRRPDVTISEWDSITA